MRIPDMSGIVIPSFLLIFIPSLIRTINLALDSIIEVYATDLQLFIRIIPDMSGIGKFVLSDTCS